MTTASKDLLVLKSEAGEYFVLPQELLERGRVPAEHTADAERAFASAQAEDVEGHLNFPKIEFEYRFVGTLVGGGTAIGAMFYNLPHDAEVGGMIPATSTHVEGQRK